MTKFGRTCVAMTALLASGFSTDLMAADGERGRLLYENHCTVCHTSVAHVRAGRKARSQNDIRKQVLRWSAHLELHWGASEVTDVVEYLNRTYYQFTP